MKFLLTFTALIFVFAASAQLASDFTVTDSDGIERSLYADHLDQGQTVVVELFFVACPPCRAAAPNVQARYVDWGAGQFDVEFIKLSTQNGDSNAEVAQFKEDFGTTFPGVGFDGGATPARMQFMDGTHGPFLGTPMFVVIAPDGTVNSGVFLSGLSDAIAATGAVGDDSVVEPPEFTTYTLGGNSINGLLPQQVDYILQSADGVGGTYNITQATGGTNVFDYPSDIFPELNQPVVSVAVSGPALDSQVKASDLLRIQRHILGINEFSTVQETLAADVNGDLSIKASDLLIIQRVILGIIDDFPNGVPSWRTIPASMSLDPAIGQQIDLEFEFVKVGSPQP